MVLFVNYLRALIQIKKEPGIDVYVYHGQVLSVTTQKLDGIINQNLKCKALELDVNTIPRRVFVNYVLKDHSDSHISVINDIEIHSISLSGAFNPAYITEEFIVDEISC